MHSLLPTTALSCYAESVHPALEIGFELDRRYHLLRNEMETSKKPDLILLARLLDETHTPYAVIGGVALQIHQHEPRTTLDVDLAIDPAGEIPRVALMAAGFVHTGTLAHSENWRAPGGTPVQISRDPAFAPAIADASSLQLEGVPLRVIKPGALIKAKLRAAVDPARRKSKRLQDLADVQALLEQDPGLEAVLTDEERSLLR